jgi:uncharacterized OB-fold protein
MPNQIPLVDYLVLGDDPHLDASECTKCGARFFGRHNACANCSNTEFKTAPVPNDGELIAFTIVAFASPGVPVPYVPGQIDCGGTRVRANVINTPPDPEHITLGMKLRLATFSLGEDEDGIEAIGFGYEPIA